MIIVPYSWHDYISNHVSLRNQTPFFKCSLNALSVLQLTSPQRDEHFSSFNSLRIVYFNSRLCKETNVNSSGDVDFGWIFQLTSPQGDERILIVWSIVPENFNSHLRKETNYPIRQTFQKLTHFNSRLLSETNIVEVICFACFFISIHVSVRRRTFIEFGLCKNAAISTHVSARERTIT